MKSVSIRLLLLFQLVLIATTAFAQKVEIFTFDTTYHVYDDGSYNKITVIDDRSNKGDIGTVAASQFRNGRVIVPSKELTSLIADFGQNFISGKQNGTGECLFVIRDFRFSFSSSAPGTFYLSADMFIGNNGKYKFLYAIDTLCEFSGGMRIGGQYSSAIFSELMVYAGKLDINALQGNTYALNDAAGRYKQFYKQYPVYTATPIKEGLYKNIDEFLRNSPAIAKLHRKDRADHEGRHRQPFTTFYYDDNGERGDEVDSFFAVYNKGEWFVENKTGRPTKMVVRNGDFYTKMSVGSLFYQSPTQMFTIARWNKDSLNGVYEFKFNPELKRFMPYSKVSN